MVQERQADLRQRMEDAYAHMSKGQHAIAKYITDNYDKAAFMTASRLGDLVGVSESTVVRFSIALGYAGYPQLQKALQEMIRSRLTTVQRIEMSVQPGQYELRSLMKTDINNLRRTLEDLDNEAFQLAVAQILAANRVYIVGVRSAAPLAQFLGYYLNYVLDDVRPYHSGLGDVFEHLIRLSSADLVIGISFPRYSARTSDALAFAHKAGARTLAITDSVSSPLAAHADICLTAHSDIAAFVDSLVAPLSLINALILAVGMQRKEQISQRFEELESVWETYHVYTGKEQ